MHQQFPKQCSCCGETIEAGQWPSLPYVGTQDVPAGEFGEPAYYLEHRNHDRGTTLSVERPWHDADARRNAEVDSAARAARRDIELAGVATRRLEALS